ncbi:MAG: glutamyl-tRNA reductase [Ilumatobacteraceae bacterium]
MSIVVIGLNHRTSPVEVLERVMIPEAEMQKALHGIASRDDIREAVLLSTCNRTEVYASAERFHGAFDDIRDFFCEVSGLSSDEIAPLLYTQHDEWAVSHLFAVSSGLDSAVLGETEIVGQVRGAWERAMGEGVSRSTLNLLFRHALEVGKRARTETGISKSTASVSHAAVEMATEILGTLDGSRVVVVGAGAMGEGVAVALSRAGAGVTVVNRSHERGTALADKVGASLVDFSQLESALASADVVVACTGSGEQVVTAAMIERVRTGSTAPLLVVDIALPRDVEPVVGEIDGVTLRDLDDLSRWASRGIEQRSAEVDQVRSIITDEVERFVFEQAKRQAAPLVAQMHEAAERVRVSEIERFSAKLDGLDTAQRDVVEALTKAIVAKLLHQPSVSLRDAAGTPQGERLSAAVHDLFHLD